MKKLPIYQIHQCASILGEVTTDYYIDFDEFKQRLEELTKKGYTITEVYNTGHRNIVDIEYTPRLPLDHRLKPLRELHFDNKDKNRKYHYHVLFDHHYGTNDQKEFTDFISYYNGLGCLINDVSIEHGKDGTYITVYIKAKSKDDDITTCYKKHEKYYNDIIKALSIGNRLKTLSKVVFIDDNNSIKYRYHFFFDQQHYGTNDFDEFTKLIEHYSGDKCFIDNLNISWSSNDFVVRAYIKSTEKAKDFQACIEKHQKYLDEIEYAHVCKELLNENENDNITLIPSIEIYRFGLGLTKETVKERRQKFFDAIYQEYRINGLRDCTHYGYDKDESLITVVFTRGKTNGCLALDQLYKDVAELCKPFEE